MKLDKFNQPRFYLRRDADAGWTLALWKWRLFFQVNTSPAATISDEQADRLRRIYNDAYCGCRRAGMGGGDAERHAMRVLVSHVSALEA